MINQYGRYMKGAYPIPELMKLKPREFMEWYKIMEREIVEEYVLSKHDSKKAPLEGKALQRKVNTELERRRNKNG